MRLSEKSKQSLTIVIISTLIFLMLWLASISPESKEQYINLYVLDKERTTKGLYPSNNSNIPVGTTVEWLIGIQNLMDKTEYVSLKIKLGNETHPNPDIINYTLTTNELDVITEFQQVVKKEERYEIPFFWYISQISVIGNHYQLVLNINNQEFECDVTAVDGHNFRLIFELWRFDQVTQDFIFKQSGDREGYGLWIQLWFNATTSI